jgi:hypothetical protein
VLVVRRPSGTGAMDILTVLSEDKSEQAIYEPLKMWDERRLIATGRRRALAATRLLPCSHCLRERAQAKRSLLRS